MFELWAACRVSHCATGVYEARTRLWCPSTTTMVNYAETGVYKNWAFFTMGFRRVLHSAVEKVHTVNITVTQAIHSSRVVFNQVWGFACVSTWPDLCVHFRLHAYNQPLQYTKKGGDGKKSGYTSDQTVLKRAPFTKSWSGSAAQSYSSSLEKDAFLTWSQISPYCKLIFLLSQ